MRDYKFKTVTLMQIMEDRALMAQVLAKDMGITKSALSRKINGNRPWTEVELKRVSQILNLPQSIVFPPEEYRGQQHEH